jgi:hypothetical protein
MTNLRVELLPRSRAVVYLRRADNLLKTMEWADREENPDGLATSAIQAAIALGDAFTISFLQRRSRGQDHLEVLLLIRQCKAASAPVVSRLLQRVIVRKEDVQYKSREVQLHDARELAKHTRALNAVVREAVG